jgi:hypothetical protein
MRRSKLALAAMAGLVAAEAGAHAASVPDTKPAAEKGGTAIERASDAALEQILAANWLDKLKDKGKGFTEYYWKGQAFKQAQLKNPLPAPSGDVAAIFGSLKIS